MEIKIKAESKEIAALVVAIQERQTRESEPSKEEFANTIKSIFVDQAASFSHTHEW